MTCQNCGAGMHRDGERELWVCDYCDSSQSPERTHDGIRVFESVTGRNCPICAQPLVEASVTGSSADYCRKCGGVLMRVGAFLDAQAALRVWMADAAPTRTAADPSELDRHIHCPGCGRVMDTHFYGGGGSVVIDNCPDCEWNWFDRSELMRASQPSENRAVSLPSD